MLDAPDSLDLMRAIEARIVGKLDLKRALQAEAVAPNSVLPTQPGMKELASQQSDRFATWLTGQLTSGLAVSSRSVVNARKPRHGIRPAPILGIPERVAYRAMVDEVLAGEPPLTRTRQDYLSFVRGPVDYVLDKAAGLRTLGLLLDDDEIQYVVKTDLAAFYEYIDHGILGRVIASRSGNIALVEVVTEILGEIEGRNYGLPQMFEASDRLSELYARLVQDQLARRGFLIWRFNDDFRIGVPSFEAALDAIEAISEEARSLGLVMNEQKTITPRFENYAIATFGLNSVEDEIPLGEQDEVEAAVGEYTEMFGDPGDAVALLSHAVSSHEGWNLGDVNQEQVSQLRRALWSTTRAKDPRALSALVPLATYVPSLTPVLCRYAEALAPNEPELVATRVDALVNRVSLGGWQRLWLNRLLRTTGLIHEGSPGDTASRIVFAQASMFDRRHPVTRAEAALTLADTGGLSVQSLVDSLVTEPRALASWYVVAAHKAARSERDQKILQGISGSDPFYAMLLDSLA